MIGIITIYIKTEGMASHQDFEDELDEYSGLVFEEYAGLVRYEDSEDDAEDEDSEDEDSDVDSEDEDSEDDADTVVINNDVDSDEEEEEEPVGWEDSELGPPFIQDGTVVKAVWPREAYVAGRKYIWRDNLYRVFLSNDELYDFI